MGHGCALEGEKLCGKRDQSLWSGEAGLLYATSTASCTSGKNLRMIRCHHFYLEDVFGINFTTHESVWRRSKARVVDITTLEIYFGTWKYVAVRGLRGLGEKNLVFGGRPCTRILTESYPYTKSH